MGKIVYHGTWSSRPPHEYGDTFHAGTRQSAIDRLFSAEGIPEYEGHRQAIHSYELSDPSVVDPTLYADPHPWDENLLPRLPRESDTINKYLNEHESPGSISYVIPSHMVQSGIIKHLGAQWSIDPYDERNAPIVNAYRSMLGGKTK